MVHLEALRQAVLIVGTGEATKSYFDICENLNLVTVGIDRNPLDSNAAIHIPVSTYDFDSAEKACQRVVKSNRLEVVGVLSRSSGPAVITVSRLAQSFGVPGVSEGLARACVSKKELARQTELLSIPSPRLFDDWVEICTALCSGKKVVAKPDIPIVGKKGVSVISTLEEAASAVHVASSNSYNSEAIVQEYVPGEDIFLVTFVQEGHIRWTTFFEERVGFVSGEFFSQGLRWEAETRFEAATEMKHCAKSFLRTNPCSGTVVFSFRLSGVSALLYEVNTGLVGDGLFDNLWTKVWPSDNPFLREAMVMIGRDASLPDVAGIPAKYYPGEV